VTIGQFRPMNNLQFGYHLNADSNDMMGNQNGVDYNMAYTGDILGPAAYYNGSSARVYLSIATVHALLGQATFSIAVLVRPDTGWETYPIVSRCYVSTPTRYGLDWTITTSGMEIHRWQGSSTDYNMSTSYSFTAEHVYLIGLTYNKSNGATVFYIYPLYPAEASKIASGSLGTGDVGITATYDDGWNLGARLRKVSPVWGKGSMNECLIFDDVRTAKWYAMYAQLLKTGFE